MMTANSRKHPRHELRNPAIILLPGFYLDATVVDVSQSGLLLDIPDVRLVPRNATCVVRLLSESGRQLVEMEAKVARYAGSHRIGIETCNVSPGARGALHRLLEPSLRHESTAKREVSALLRRVDPAILAAANTANSGAALLRRSA